MKRSISCLLALILVISVFCSTSIVAFADDEPAFTVSSAAAFPSESVSVPILIEANPGVASIKLKVRFDSELSLSKITYNTELGGRSQQPETFTSPVTLNWFNGDADTEGDMVYAVLDFAVADNAAPGDHPVTITYDEDDVYNYAEENIAFKTVNGSVYVKTAVTGLALGETSATVKTGDFTYTLTPVFSPADATNQNVSWKSSDESVATVDGGVVTLIKKGEVVITATSEEGGFEASCTLNILCSHLTTEVIPAEKSTLTEHGHGEYTVCKECGEIVSGSDAPLPKLYLVGDVDGNGKVNNRDAVILDRYIADWDGYAEVIVNMDAADMSRDKKVNNRDAVILDRYVADWEGYEAFIIIVDPNML